MNIHTDACALEGQGPTCITTHRAPSSFSALAIPLWKMEFGSDFKGEPYLECLSGMPIINHGGGGGGSGI